MRFVVGLGAFVATTGWRFYHQHLSRWEGDQMSGGYEIKTYMHKSKVREIRLGVNKGTSFEFIVRREKGYDRLLKHIGIAEEIQTGDKMFDAAYYIISDEIELAHRLQRDSKLRDTVQQIFARYKPDELHIGRGRLWVRFIAPKVQGIRGQEGLASLLKLLAEQLGNMRLTVEVVRRQPTAWIAAAFMAFHMGFLIGGISMLVFCTSITDLFQLALTALGAGLALSVSWLLLVSAVMGKSSRVALVFFDFAIIGFAGMCMISGGSVASYNIEYDTSAPHTIHTEVVDKYTRKGRRGSRRYYIEVQHWKDKDDTYSIKVNSSTFSTVQKGATATIDLRDGALGFEWMENYQFTNDMKMR